MRRLLAAAVALAPLCIVSSAHADETISGGKKGPVLTSSSGNVTVSGGGSVTPGELTPAPSGCTPTSCPSVSIFLNSNNTVTNNGNLGSSSLPVAGGATGVLIQAGNAGSVGNTSSITLMDSYTPPTDQNTGITYGLWTNTTNPQNNYGIRLIGPGTFSGSIASTANASITVNGNDSYGISIEAPLDGSTSNLVMTGAVTGSDRTIALESLGNISVTGTHAVGINIAGTVTKDVLLQGTITAMGQNAVGMQTSADINGRLTIGSAISATGYHYTSRPMDTTIKMFSYGPFTPQAGPNKGINTETLQGGPAVWIGGNVAGGMVLDASPITSATTSATNNDVDLNGIVDSAQTTGSIAAYGQAPALVIGSSAQTVTLGPVGTPQATGAAQYDYGLILKGNVTADGVYDGFSATAIQLGGTLSGPSGPQTSQAVTIQHGGMLIAGSVSANAYQQAATGIQVNSGVTLGDPSNSSAGITNAGGSITALSNGSGITPNNLSGAALLTYQETQEANQQAVAIGIAAGASVPSITNTMGSMGVGGAISATIGGDYGNAVAIQDNSGTLKSITNTGSISAMVDVAPGTTPRDESPTAQYLADGTCDTHAGGCAIAIDARANTTGLTIIQQASSVPGAPPSIVGDVYLPTASTANSLVEVTAGSVTGTINLGGGAVTLAVGNGASVGGPLIYGAQSAATSQLTIDVAGTLFDGVLNASRSPIPGAVYAKSITVAPTGTLYAALDPLSPTKTTGYYALTADLQAGAKIGVNFVNLVPTGQTVVMNYIQTASASDLQLGGPIDTSAVVHPYLFNTLVGTSTGGNGMDVIAACNAGEICVQASQKTAQQAGMNQAQAGFYNAAYAGLGGSDADLRSLFLSKVSKANFFRDYNQLMPVAGGAALLSLSTGMREISRALADTRPVAEPGEVTGWTEEINYYADHGESNGLGFRTNGIGVASGVERGTRAGAFGVSMAFTSGDMKTPSQIGASDLGATAYEAGLYWRFAHNGWRAWARGAVGYASFNSTRDFMDNPLQSTNSTTLAKNTPTTTGTTGSTGATGAGTTSTIGTQPYANLPIYDVTVTQPLMREATANWNGYTLSGGAGMSWEQHFARRYFLRPELTLEYMRLSESGYTENNASGGINGIPLIVNSRTGDILTTSVMLNLGARFGDITGQGGVTAELHAGYRDNVSADPGVTTLQFLSNKGAYAYVPGDALTGGGPVLGFRIMAGGPMGYVALEGDAEQMALYNEYVLLIRAAYRF